jgi:hypothetical protein
VAAWVIRLGLHPNKVKGSSIESANTLTSRIEAVFISVNLQFEGIPQRLGVVGRRLAFVDEALCHALRDFELAQLLGRDSIGCSFLGGRLAKPVSLFDDGRDLNVIRHQPTPEPARAASDQGAA